MTDLEPVDKVEVHVLIDNVTDSHSTIHDHAESEFSFLERHGMTELSGNRICCAWRVGRSENQHQAGVQAVISLVAQCNGRVNM